jgi:hypothetical protein
MNHFAASDLHSGSGDGGWVLVLVFVFIAAASFAGVYWRFVVQWIRGIRGRDWTPVSAIIDVVSVAPEVVQTKGGERTVGYVATLTYFYRNPELQMGEYSRSFNDEAEAQEWADSYKGRNVMVHVDPRDPTRSVLLKQEL